MRLSQPTSSHCVVGQMAYCDQLANTSNRILSNTWGALRPVLQQSPAHPGHPDDETGYTRVGLRGMPGGVERPRPLSQWRNEFATEEKLALATHRGHSPLVFSPTGDE